MKTEFVALFAVIAVVAAQTTDAQDQKCEANEVFKTCGTACEPSCEKPNPTICTKQCVIGCQCKKGFYRNSDKECVKLEECKTVSTKCAANETFTDCHNPCTEPKCPRKNAPVVRCMMLCQKACGCSVGYARNMQGKCVKESDCPKEENPDENPCNLVDCRSGLICQLKNGQPTCVRAKRASCMTMKCSKGFECRDRKCVSTENIEPVGSCMTMRCGTPGGCAMVLPESCPAGKCKAQPMCVSANPCHWIRCANCVLRQVTCVKAPCDPVAECL